jgi:hypothetical protein
MTVELEARETIGLGTGATRDWNFAFRVYDEGHVQVSVLLAEGVNYEVVPEGQYTLALGAGNAQDGFAGGVVTYPISPTPVLGVGTKLKVERVVPFTQVGVDLTNASGFDPRALERELDLHLMLLQQMRDGVGLDGVVLAPDTMTNNLLPDPDPGTLLGWNDAGNGLVNRDPTGVGANTIVVTNGTATRNLADKLADVLSLRDFGAMGDGVTNDTVALQAALDSGHDLRGAPGATYLVSMVPGLDVPDGTTLYGVDFTFRFEGVTGVLATPFLRIGDDVNIQQLRISTPGLETEGVAVMVGDTFRCELLYARCDQLRVGGLFLETRGQLFIVDSIDIEDQDRPLVFNNIDGDPEIDEDDLFEGGWITSTSYTAGDIVATASKFYRCLISHIAGTFATDLAAGRWVHIPATSGSYMKHVRLRNYVRGFRAINADSWKIDNFDCRTASPRAEKEPGNNGLLISGSNNWHIGLAHIEDSGEHAFRVGGAGAVGWSVNTFKIWRPGGCAFKINPGHAGGLCRKWVVGQIYAEDVGKGATTGNNEFIRITHSRTGQIASAMCVTGAQVISCKRGVQLNDVFELTIGNLRLLAPHGNIIGFDEGSDGNVSNPAGDVKNVKIRVQGESGVGEGAISVNMPLKDLADIFIEVDISELADDILKVVDLNSLEGDFHITGSVGGDEPPTVEGLTNTGNQPYIDVRYKGRRRLGNPANMRQGYMSSLQLESPAFDAGDVATHVNTIYLDATGLTAGAGNYGGAVVFGRLGSGRRAAAIAVRQASADAEQVDLDLFYSANTIATDALQHKFRFQHDGRLKIMGSGDGIILTSPDGAVTKLLRLTNAGVLELTDP